MAIREPGRDEGERCRAGLHLMTPTVLTPGIFLVFVPVTVQTGLSRAPASSPSPARPAPSHEVTLAALAQKPHQ